MRYNRPIRLGDDQLHLESVQSPNRTANPVFSRLGAGL